MKLDLSDHETSALIKSVFIAAWVSESSDKPDKEAIASLEQKLYRLVFEAGKTDLVEYDEDMKLFFVCPDKEEAWVEDYIAPHDDEHLWESLQMELARRDFARVYTPAQSEAMDDGERLEKLSELLRKYTLEFASSGLENLEIRK